MIVSTIPRSILLFYFDSRRQGKKVLELGSYVKANFLGNDPVTAERIFTVTEESKLQPVPLTPISTPQQE
ncbi:unnamed protein product [Schistocephalus solidus]|uniref:Uncharacterized protein n=1 Tax=Schistocephalus solidus TaxID=70667 RepID=A0A183SCZ7_SCHSO|nr:unnamed protein product [Schistocephalus solidus]